MTESKFKIGDRVRIFTSGRGGFDGFSKVFTIEKQHKGNGNFIVNGAQFRPWGSEVTGRSHAWRSSQLIIDGSDECAKAIANVHKLRDAEECQHLMRVVSPHQMPDDLLRRLLEVLREIAAGKAQEPKP